MKYSCLVRILLLAVTCFSATISQAGTVATGMARIRDFLVLSDRSLGSSPFTNTNVPFDVDGDGNFTATNFPIVSTDGLGLLNSLEGPSEYASSYALKLTTEASISYAGVVSPPAATGLVFPDPVPFNNSDGLSSTITHSIGDREGSATASIPDVFRLNLDAESKSHFGSPPNFGGITAQSITTALVLSLTVEAGLADFDIRVYGQLVDALLTASVSAGAKTFFDTASSTLTFDLTLRNLTDSTSVTKSFSSSITRAALQPDGSIDETATGFGILDDLVSSGPLASLVASGGDNVEITFVGKLKTETTTYVPEPTSLALWGIASFSFVVGRRRRGQV